MKAEGYEKKGEETKYVKGKEDERGNQTGGSKTN